MLARAAAPEASARLDAAGFAARLGALASALPAPAPLPLHPPEHVPLEPVNGFRAPGVSELTQIATVVERGGGQGAGRRALIRPRSAPGPVPARSSTPSRAGTSHGRAVR